MTKRRSWHPLIQVFRRYQQYTTEPHRHHINAKPSRSSLSSAQILHICPVSYGSTNQGDVVMLNALKSKRFRNRAMIGIVIVAVLLLAGQTFLSGEAQTTTNVTGKVVSVMAAKNVES